MRVYTALALHRGRNQRLSVLGGRRRGLSTLVHAWLRAGRCRALTPLQHFVQAVVPLQVHRAVLLLKAVGLLRWLTVGARLDRLHKPRLLGGRLFSARQLFLGY